MRLKWKRRCLPPNHEPKLHSQNKRLLAMHSRSFSITSVLRELDTEQWGKERAAAKHLPSRSLHPGAHMIPVTPCECSKGFLIFFGIIQFQTRVGVAGHWIYQLLVLRKERKLSGPDSLPIKQEEFFTIVYKDWNNIFRAHGMVVGVHAG